MKPLINLRKCSKAVVSTCIFLVAFSLNNAGAKALKNTSIAGIAIDAVGMADNTGNLNLTIPAMPVKKQTQHHPAGTKKDNQSDEMKKGKTHADEEKHKNHLYHYTRIKRKKKSHIKVICIALKIFIAISYISVLICGFMSICH